MDSLVVFLSHSGADSEAALSLAERLEAVPELRERGWRVWIDRRDLVPGRDWQLQIEQAIRGSAAFLVYIGSRGTMNWVDREVRLGLNRAATAADGSYAFIPVVSRECASVDGAHLPDFASTYQGLRDVEHDGAAFARLVQALCNGGDRQPPRLVVQPFIGLRSFDLAHRHLYFGREVEAQELLEDLREQPLLMLVGDSGSGKSSLIRAGVLPLYLGGALEVPSRQAPDPRAWHALETRPAFPSNNPFENLAQAIYECALSAGASMMDAGYLRDQARTGDGGRILDALRDAPRGPAMVVLAIDQFEELFTSCSAEARSAFVDMLVSFSQRRDAVTVRVVMSMRWDYYNLCSAYPAFFACIEPGRRRIAPMERRQMLRCVIEPLKLGGVDGDRAAAFAETVLHDASSEPGDLAILQMALYQTWRRLKSPQGDLQAAYAAAGRVSGALADEAERVFCHELDHHEKALAQTLLQRLVRLGDTGGVSRRVMAGAEIPSDELPIAQRLASESGGRLLQLRASDAEGRFTIELTHEKLATQWPRFQNWLQADAGLKRVHDQLADRARRWIGLPTATRAKDLVTGLELEQAETLRRAQPRWLAPAENQLLQASREAGDAQLAVEQGRAARERRATRLIRRLGVLAIVAAAMASVLAGWGWWSARAAGERLVDVEWGNAVTRLDWMGLPLEARHYAARVARDSRDTARGKAAAFLVGFHAGDWLRLRSVLPHEGPVDGSAFDKDGTRVLTWSEDGSARVWEADGGKPVSEPMKHAGPVRGATFDKDGTRVLTWSEDGSARVWEAGSGKPMSEPMTHAKGVLGATFDRGGARVLTWGADGSARVWEAASGNPVSEPMKHAGGVSDAAFDKDGTRVLTWSFGGTARVWDAAGGKPVSEPMKHAQGVRGATFDQDGTRVLTWGDRDARVWEAASGEPVSEPMTHAQIVSGSMFNKDGTRVLTWANFGSARVWRAAGGKPVSGPMKHAEEGVQGATFDKDGTRVLTWSEDGSARVWEAAGGKLVSEPMKHRLHVEGATFDKDGVRVLTWSTDGSARVWEAASGKPVSEPLRLAESLSGAAFDKDVARVLTWSADGSARVWQAASGKPVSEPMKHAQGVWGARFDKGGARVLTWGADGSARVWEAASGKPVSEPMTDPQGVRGATFDQDSTYVLTWSDDDSARVWQAASGKPVSVPMKHAGPVRGATFDKDGAHVLTWSDDASARIWETASGKPVSEPMKHARGVRGATFDQDGARVLTWSDDGSARVWQAASGKPVSVPMKHAGPVRGATFDKDGAHVLTWSDDATARVWEAVSGKPVSEPLKHAREVWGAAFDKDGTRVLTWGGDGNARVWLTATPAAFPPYLLPLMTSVRTGTRINAVGDLEALSAAEWQAAKDEFARRVPKRLHEVLGLSVPPGISPR